MKLNEIVGINNQKKVSKVICKLDGVLVKLEDVSLRLSKRVLPVNKLSRPCMEAVHRMLAVSKYNVSFREFIVNIKKHKTALLCRFDAKGNVLFVVDVMPSSEISRYSGFSILTINGLYEVFDNDLPLIHRGYTIKETEHSFERIHDRNIKNIITREQVEQILKQAIDTVEALELLDFNVAHAVVYGRSAQQSIIIDVDHDMKEIDIATYFPNTSAHVANNCILITVD